MSEEEECDRFYCPSSHKKTDLNDKKTKLSDKSPKLPIFSILSLPSQDKFLSVPRKLSLNTQVPHLLLKREQI